LTFGTDTLSEHAVTKVCQAVGLDRAYTPKQSRVADESKGVEMSLKPLTRSISFWTMASIALGLAVGLPADATAEDQEFPLRFNAVAINMSNVGARTQQRLEVAINRTSSDEERAKLMEALKTQTQRGDRALADTLFGKDSVGTIREVQSLSYDLRYARINPMEGGGYQVIAATDRPIQFAESWRSSRTLDYNVSLLILEIGENGRGEGQLMLGAEFRWNEESNTVEITNFSSEPIRLTNVRQR